MRQKAKVRGGFVEVVYRDTLYELYMGRCGICGQNVSQRKFTIDHIIPASRGGEHSYQNCQPAHQSCNQAKADRTPWEYAEVVALEKKRARKKRKLHYRNLPKNALAATR